MRWRSQTWLALLVAVLVPVLARAADTPATPTVVVRLNTLDNVIADLRYLIEMAGKEEEAKQAEALFKNLAGDKGLEGIDTKRPIGFYARISPKFQDSAAVVLIPVTDEATVLDYLKRLDIKAEKDNDIYKVGIPNTLFSAYFRFANKYLYITAAFPAMIAKANLLDPESVLAGDKGDLLTLTVNADQIPEHYKGLAMDIVSQRLMDVKKQKVPGDVAELKGLRDAILEEVAGQIKSIVHDSRKVQASLKVDRQAADLTANLKLTAKPGSTLAENIAELGKSPSVAASLVGSNSAFNAMLHLSVPARLRKAIDPLIDEGTRKLLDNVTDNDKRDLLKMLVDCLIPTIKSGELDVGVNMAGPSAGGMYTLTLGGRVKEGAGIEKAVKTVAGKVPPQALDRIKLDADKAGSVNIHKVMPEDFDPKLKKALGDDTIYLAVRDDALLMTVGEHSDKALKALANATPRAGSTFQLEISFARFAPLMAPQQKNATAAAKKAFAGGKDDTLRLSLTGGQSLSLSLSAKAQIIRFGTLLDEMNKMGQ